VASLQDAAAAHRFAEHLQESGISAGVERVNTSKGVWHRINVTLSGTTEEAQALRRRLATLGIRQPLLKEQETISD
jgi:cell division septation protein DedD